MSDPRPALLRRLGLHRVEHDSHVPFTAHLVGTSRLLERWGARRALCDAGMFHSAYGTEWFSADVQVERDEVREVIGVDAEDVVWWWCSIERRTLDPDACTVVERRRGRRVTLPAGRVEDLATLWAADTVEQLARMGPDERGFAVGLGRVLPAALPAARAAVEALPEPLPSLPDPSGGAGG